MIPPRPRTYVLDDHPEQPYDYLDAAWANQPESRPVAFRSELNHLLDPRTSTIKIQRKHSINIRILAGITLVTPLAGVGVVMLFGAGSAVETEPTSSTPAPAVTSHHDTNVPWNWLAFIVAAFIIVTACVWGVSLVRTKATQRRERLAQRTAITAAWSDLGRRLDTVTARWDAYESDPKLFLTQPAIRDVSVPEVATATRALMDARARRSPHPGADVNDVADTTYYRSVADAEIAVEAAIKVTRDMVRTGMSADERKILKRAQDLLALALDGGATDAERQNAYGQCIRLLERLNIELPDTVQAVIERAHPLLLESGRR